MDWQTTHVKLLKQSAADPNIKLVLLSCHLCAYPVLVELCVSWDLEPSFVDFDQLRILIVVQLWLV